MLPELRVRLRAGLILIPDVAVYWPNKPARVPDTPPLIAVEILSDDDRLPKVRSKLKEYRAWGVVHVWLIDPYERSLYVCDDHLQEVDVLRVPELDLELHPADVFD